MSLPWLQRSSGPSSRSESRSRSRSRELGKPQRKVDQFGRSLPPKSKSRSRSNSSSSGDSQHSQESRQSGGDIRGGKRSRKGRARRQSRERHIRRKQDDSDSDSEIDSTSSSGHTRIVASNKPKYLNARVFVANIISKEITKEVLVKQFEKYGKIIDVLVHSKNYAFIQYAKEAQARLAVEGEHGSTLKGWRIDVKLATENRKGGGKSGGGKNGRSDKHGGRTGSGRFGTPERERSPLHDDQIRNPYLMHYPGLGSRLPLPYPAPGSYGLRDPYYPSPYRRGFPDPWLDDPLYRPSPYVEPYRDPYGIRTLPPPAAVECEIFVMTAQLRGYGEAVERRVKEHNIITAVSVMPEGRTSAHLLEELTTHNSLFAIFINPQNETHRSLTLNILHGVSQEHRNMPLDDAVALIGRSFVKYVEGLRGKPQAPAATLPPSSSAPATRVFLPPSTEVVYLFNLLADNRAVTVAELDVVIGYLQERREKLIDAERRPILTEAENSHKTIPPVQQSDSTQSPSQDTATAKSKDPGPVHQELKSKILSLFGSVGDSVQGVPPASGLPQQQPFLSSPAVAPAPPPQAPPPIPSTASLINFDNPNVRKALDSLIQSGPNLLKSISTKTSLAAAQVDTPARPPVVRTVSDNNFEQSSEFASVNSQGQMLNIQNQGGLNNSFGSAQRMAVMGQGVQGSTRVPSQVGYSVPGDQGQVDKIYMPQRY